MAGYTPVFSSVFQGSLCGKFPDLYVWLVMLGLADKNGEVDCHPSYIATVSGIAVKLVEQAIESLCQPDPQSRTQTLDGRRLTAIPGRGFGWTIVNFAKYREKARKAAYDALRTETGRNAERMRARRADVTDDDPTRPAETRADPPSNSNAYSNSDLNPKSKRAAPNGAHKPRKVRTQIPEDFSLTDADRKFAEDRLPDVHLGETLRQFIDHHRNKGTLGLDWHAGWRTWIGNCLKGFPYVRRVRPAMAKPEQRRFATEAEYLAWEAKRRGAQ